MTARKQTYKPTRAARRFQNNPKHGGVPRTQISINVPDDTIDLVRELAAISGKSLNMAVVELVESAMNAFPSEHAPDRHRPSIDFLRHHARLAQMERDLRATHGMSELPEPDMAELAEREARVIAMRNGTLEFGSDE